MNTDTAPPVYGLVLTGGQSTRMKRDKATLPYRGKTQLDRAFELAARHCTGPPVNGENARGGKKCRPVSTQTGSQSSCMRALSQKTCVSGVGTGIHFSLIGRT